MRILKLVIWDLDETILSGVLEESAEINPLAIRVMAQLRAQGTLQALATYNQSEVLQTALEKCEWSHWFVQTEASLNPKAMLVRRILDSLSMDPLDTAFIDEDPFERDSMAIQVPGISAW